MSVPRLFAIVYSGDLDAIVVGGFLPIVAWMGDVGERQLVSREPLWFRWLPTKLSPFLLANPHRLALGTTPLKSSIAHLRLLKIYANTMASLRSSPPGSPDSQMSAPMEESDSDSDSPQNRARSADDDSNQYPIENLFKSHEEKARIMSMREIEREQILAERRELHERIRQNRMLRQLKVNQEKDSKKRKASAADLEDASRKSARARKAGEGADKMDTLRRAREERSNRKEQRERENDRRRQRSPSYRRSRSADDHDSDVDWRRESRQKSRTPERREILPAELRDVERIRVGRSRFAEVCFYPGFEKAIAGCYVRINIGPDPTTRQDVYRMAVIKSE